MEQRPFFHVPLGGSHCIHTSTITWKTFLIRTRLVFCRFISRSTTHRIVLSCFIRFTLICHFAVILQLLLRQSAFLTRGRHSINTCGIELTSLVSVLFLLPKQKCPEKLGLTFLFSKQPPTSANNVQNCAPARTPWIQLSVSQALRRLHPFWCLRAALALASLLFTLTFWALRPALIPQV